MMNVELSEETKRWIEQQVAMGVFPTPETAIEAAIRSYRAEGNGQHEDDLIDHEFIAYCERELEGKDVPSIEEVHAGTASIKDSMARVVIEEERSERF